METADCGSPNSGKQGRGHEQHIRECGGGATQGPRGPGIGDNHSIRFVGK